MLSFGGPCHVAENYQMNLSVALVGVLPGTVGGGGAA